MSASEIAPKPKSLDVVTAAAVPVVGLTAWQGLFDVGGLQAGQTVLIHGAGGGVGSFAVQFAVAKGARVLATAAGDKIPLLRELGVSEAIDYTTTRFEEVARDVDVVFDTVGGDVQARSLTVLKYGGILVSTVRQPDAEAARAYGVRATWRETQPDAAQHAEIARLIDAGMVKPVVSSVLPLFVEDYYQADFGPHPHRRTASSPMVTDPFAQTMLLPSASIDSRRTVWMYVAARRRRGLGKIAVQGLQQSRLDDSMALDMALMT